MLLMLSLQHYATPSISTGAYGIHCQYVWENEIKQKRSPVMLLWESLSACVGKGNKPKTTNTIDHFNEYSTASDPILLFGNMITHHLTLFLLSNAPK